jgi:hypothetical protein
VARSSRCWPRCPNGKRHCSAALWPHRWPTPHPGASWPSLRDHPRAHPADRDQDDGQTAPPLPFSATARLPRLAGRHRRGRHMARPPHAVILAASRVGKSAPERQARGGSVVHSCIDQECESGCPTKRHAPVRNAAPPLSASPVRRQLLARTIPLLVQPEGANDTEEPL